MLVNRQTDRPATKNQKQDSLFFFFFKLLFLLFKWRAENDVFSYHTDIKISNPSDELNILFFFFFYYILFFFTTSAFTSDDDESVYKSIIDRSLSLSTAAGTHRWRVKPHKQDGNLNINFFFLFRFFYTAANGSRVGYRRTLCDSIGISIDSLSLSLSYSKDVARY
jgi:hypothetical protein